MLSLLSLYFVTSRSRLVPVYDDDISGALNTYIPRLSPRLVLTVLGLFALYVEYPSVMAI